MSEAELKRILVVDDSKLYRFFIENALREAGSYEVVCAESIPQANEIVSKTLEAGKRFDAALVELKVGTGSGAEFAQRLQEIVVDIGVGIVTGYYNPAVEMLNLYKPDEVVIKEGNWTYFHHARPGKTSTLLQAVARLVQPRRLGMDPEDVRLNLWKATGHMGGMGSLRLFTYTTNGEPERQTEKFVSLTTPEHGRERWWVNTVVYPGHPSENSEPVAIQTTIGCNIGCQMCSNPRNQKGLDGVTIPYVRPLSTEEMLAQVYLATNSPRIRRLFRNDVDTGLLVNFTGPGDGLANNLKNCAAVIEHLSKIEKPAVSFVITSVGREDRLKEYLNRYIDLPRVTQYWSVNSLNNQVRSTLMPGTRGQNLENLRGLYQKIAEKTGRPVTASFALFKGLNDGWDDVERITAFFQGKPFRIKLMAGCPRSMPDIPDITGAEVEAFRDKLVYLGLPPEMVRVRTIYGIDVGEYSGCGNTQPDFLVGDLSESS